MLLVQDDGLGDLRPGGGSEVAADSIPSHPLGVKPLGNRFFSSGRNAREHTGTLGQLPDEMLLHFLDYVDASSMKALGYSCRFLFAFCYLDDLWKSHFLE